MRISKRLIPLALLLIFHPASHASAHNQTTARQQTTAARPSQAIYRPAAANRHHVLTVRANYSLPETINPQAPATVFSYLVNLIRGFFSRAW